MIYLADGTYSEHTWHSKGPMTVEQARLAMHAVVEQLVKDVEQDEAVDAGFVMQCR